MADDSSHLYTAFDKEAERKKAPLKCVIGLVVVVVLAAIIVLTVVLSSSGANENSPSNIHSNSSSTHETNTSGANSTVLISSDYGMIQGNVLSIDSTHKIYEFVGIGYAESPIGENRFRPAILKNNSNETIYNARSYGNACPQFDYGLNTKIDEDCLFLNIWTPFIPKNNSDDLLAVMVFIHGGGYDLGSGSEYNGTELIVRGGYDVVLVSINYRLGILGYLQTHELYIEGTSGIYGYNWPSYGGLNGIYDQIQAIRWVKKFIDSFGGDPDRITIFGESAGALSVCQLLITPLIRDEELIYQSIVESGPCNGPWESLNFSDGTYYNQLVLQSVNYTGNVTLDYLRSLTWEEVYDIQAQNTVFEGGYWTPTIDLHVLPENANKMYLNIINSNLNDDDDDDNNIGIKLNSKRIIWGFNSQDGVAGWPFYFWPYPCTEEELENKLIKYINNSDILSNITDIYYPLSDFDNNASLAWFAINSDTCVACPQFRLSDKLNSVNDVKDDWIRQYVYQFNGYYPPYLAPHASELKFVFGVNSTTWTEGINSVKFNRKLSDEMIAAWTQFAKLGNDTHEKLEFSGYQWNEYSGAQVIVFSDNITNNGNYANNFRHGVCQYWYDVVGLSDMTAICNDILSNVTAAN